VMVLILSSTDRFGFESDRETASAVLARDFSNDHNLSE